jgi:hypothetical protein
MQISEYNRDQIEALDIVTGYLQIITAAQKKHNQDLIGHYLEFRNDVAEFQKHYLRDICTIKCYSDNSSACCNREGIAVFFADMVINALTSSMRKLNNMKNCLINYQGGNKCVYLSNSGCVWRIKPIICEMFLCDYAKTSLLKKDKALMERWEQLRTEEKQYTWPDKPVLFNELEKIFINAGFSSALMYFHKSPGLLKVKSRAGIE